MMFFKPKAYKNYVNRAHEFLLADLDLTKNNGNPHRDAVILFCGFSHFFIGYNIGCKRLNANYIIPVIVHLALPVGAHAPNHLIGHSYTEDSMHSC